MHTVTLTRMERVTSGQHIRRPQWVAPRTVANGSSIITMPSSIVEVEE